MPQSLPTGTFTCATPCCTSAVWVASSRSPTTLSVSRPALRAVTATVMVSPGCIVALVERDLEHVGRVGVGLDIPAGVERDRGQRTVRIGGRDFEPVAAEIHRQRNARRACRSSCRSFRRRRASSS